MDVGDLGTSQTQQAFKRQTAKAWKTLAGRLEKIPDLRRTQRIGHALLHTEFDRVTVTAPVRSHIDQRSASLDRQIHYVALNTGDIANEFIALPSPSAQAARFSKRVRDGAGRDLVTLDSSEVSEGLAKAVADILDQLMGERASRCMKANAQRAAEESDILASEWYLPEAFQDGTRRKLLSLSNTFATFAGKVDAHFKADPATKRYLSSLAYRSSQVLLGLAHGEIPLVVRSEVKLQPARADGRGIQRSILVHNVSNDHSGALHEPYRNHQGYAPGKIAATSRALVCRTFHRDFVVLRPEFTESFVLRCHLPHDMEARHFTWDHWRVHGNGQNGWQILHHKAKPAVKNAGPMPDWNPETLEGEDHGGTAGRGYTLIQGNEMSVMWPRRLIKAWRDKLHTALRAYPPAIFPSADARFVRVRAHYRIPLEAHMYSLAMIVILIFTVVGIPASYGPLESYRTWTEGQAAVWSGIAAGAFGLGVAIYQGSSPFVRELLRIRFMASALAIAALVVIPWHQLATLLHAVWAWATGLLPAV